MNKQVLTLLILLFASQSIPLSLQNAYPQATEITSQTALDININPVNSVHNIYKDVFEQFGDNAERLYKQYGIFTLEFLKEYKIEGLALLEKYGREITNLYPLLDYRDIFHLYNDQGNNINNLHIFSPESLAKFYKDFSDEGVRFISNNPENFFLISEDKEKGLELMNLCQRKG